MVRDILTEASYTVSEAASLEAALAHLRTSPAPLVVLLDMYLPDDDGQTVLHALEAQASMVWRHAYILMTARHTVLPPALAEQAGHRRMHFLAKPFELETLLAAVARAAQSLPDRAGATC
jgi:DNA-binding NtrC family response regulator